MKHPPAKHGYTSNATPFDPDAPRMWRCDDCGQSGPDRDDVNFLYCPKTKTGYHPKFYFVEPDGTVTASSSTGGYVPESAVTP